MINFFQDYPLLEDGDSSMLAFQHLCYFHTTSFFATSLMEGQKNYHCHPQNLVLQFVP